MHPYLLANDRDWDESVWGLVTLIGLDGIFCLFLHML